MMIFPALLKGRGSLAQLGELLEQFHCTRPMIVGSSQAVRLKTLLPNAPVFSGYHANPDWADAANGAALYLSEKCDSLVAIGGGSAIDTAKAIKAYLLADSADDALYGKFEVRPLPLIAIPGTAGTGAEVTPAAVLYIGKNKISLSHPCLIPDGVVMDSTLLDTLPLAEKKSCAMDALAQGIESYWSNGGTDESRPHALAAVHGVMRCLLPYLDGDPEAADQAMEAAYESGLAIQISRTTAAHAMSYGMTKNIGIRHGHACMLTLPHLWARLLKKPEKRPVLQAIAEAIGAPVEDIPALLEGMLCALSLQPEVNADDALLDVLASTVNIERLSNHPESMTAAELREVYQAALTPPDGENRENALRLWKDYSEHAE